MCSCLPHSLLNYNFFISLKTGHTITNDDTDLSSDTLIKYVHVCVQCMSVCIMITVHLCTCICH